MSENEICRLCPMKAYKEGYCKNCWEDGMEEAKDAGGS